MIRTKIHIILILSVFVIVLPLSTALAIPTLQLYIEGATYDADTESWYLQTEDPFTLWVIGDVGSYGTISDVQLVAAVYTDELSGGSISITPTTATGVDDPSTPSAPTLTVDPNVTPNDGERPLLGDGSELPSHGIFIPTRDLYDEGTSFFQWALGDLTLTDSPIGDYIDMFPTEFPSDGQVNAYTIDASGFTMIHFDSFDHILVGNGKAKYVFAPFSHDAFVPEPSSLLLLGVCLVALGIAGNRVRRASEAHA